MRRVFFVLLILKGWLMASTIFYIKQNGVDVPVIFEKESSLPTVNLKLVFLNSGSIRDGKKSGISKLSFRLLNEGTKKLGSTKFATLLDEKAIKLSAYSGFETAGIEFSCLKEYANDAINLTKELLKDPNYTEEALSKVKLITISQIAKKEDDFDYVAEAALREELFKGTPLQNDPLGTKESVSSITLDDVKQFLSSTLSLSNVVVVVGGDMTEDEASRYAKTVISPLREQKSEGESFFDAKSSKKEIKIQKQTEQSYIYFGSSLQVRATDKDAYKAKVAGFILGSSGFGSRLMETIRVQNGLAYSAYARFNLSKTHSYFGGHLQTKLENEEKAKKLVIDTISEFVKNGATQKELDGAKNFILGSEPLRAETLSQRLSRSFNEFYLGQPQGWHKEELNLIEKLTLEELNSFIKAHLEITELTFAIVTK